MTVTDTAARVRRVNGVDLFHEIRGDGEPLVLVHGCWTDHDSWRFVVPELAGSFRVLSYDRGGHSRSQRPAGQGSRCTDEYVRTVADFARDHAAGLSSRGN
jgi:pimeloyl-ACP methyl ester carboxylesterase